jgi:hypothetical protein
LRELTNGWRKRRAGAERGRRVDGGVLAARGRQNRRFDFTDSFQSLNGESLLGGIDVFKLTRFAAASSLCLFVAAVAAPGDDEKQTPNAEEKLRDAKLIVGPTLVWVKTDGYDYKVWAYTFQKGTNPSPRTFALRAENNEDEAPTLKEAYGRADEQKVNAHKAHYDSKPDGTTRDPEFYYAGGGPIVISVPIGGKEHVFACTPTICIQANKISLFHLACPLRTMDKAPIEGFEGTYHKAPRCKDAMATAFATKSLGKSDLSYFTLGDFVPRPLVKDK